MKVALLTVMLAPSAGGLAASVPAMARHLVRSGVETHILGTIDPAFPDGPSSWGENVHAHPVRGPLAFRYAPGLYRTLTRLDPDLVDVQGIWNYPSLASVRHARRTGRPYMVTPRGMLDPWALSRSPGKKAIVRAWFEDRHLHGAACLRATAELEAGHFRSFGLRQPIACVPNGVDVPPEPQRRTAGDGRKRILFLSRIHPKKGLPYLLRAWGALAGRRPDWDLVIAGPDEVGHEAEMRQLSAQLGVSRVRWAGPVYGAEKSRLYGEADLFVLPTHAENFGLVIAEALAHRVPVITTREAPWAGLHDNGCGWWIPLDDKALLDSMEQATAVPDGELRRMGARGREWMERSFSWEGVARQMVEVYEWLLRGERRPDFVLD